MTKEKKEIKTEEARFSKKQLLGSSRFRERKDILEALLKEDKIYSIQETEEMIEEFMKGAVR